MSVQEALKLGAYDLKRYANRSLGIAFLIALVIHIVLLGYPIVAGVFDKGGAGMEEETYAGPVTLEDFEQEELEAQEETPPVEEVVPPPPPPPMVTETKIGTGTVGAGGNFEATTEEFDGPEVSDIDNMSSAFDGGGDGGFDPNAFDDLGDMPDDLGDREKDLGAVAKAPTTEFPDFVPNATPPSYQNNELQGNLTYPTVALENDIEGTVYIKVKIDESGRVKDVQVVRSTNDIFNNSALEAVRKTTFSPAIQNGYPIPMSLTFPVKFKLKG